MTIMIPAWVDGALTPVEKLEAHVKGLRHKAVSVFVLCEDEMLLQRRASGKYHTPGLWANACCTHPDWGEAAGDCALRRLDEELGVTGLALDFQISLEYRADVGGGLTEHECVDIFLARVAYRLALAPRPSEVMDTAWVDRRKLNAWVRRRPGDFTPWLRIYLDRDVIPA